MNHRRCTLSPPISIFSSVVIPRFVVKASREDTKVMGGIRAGRALFVESAGRKFVWNPSGIGGRALACFRKAVIIAAACLSWEVKIWSLKAMVRHRCGFSLGLSAIPREVMPRGVPSETSGLCVLDFLSVYVLRTVGYGAKRQT